MSLLWGESYNNETTFTTLQWKLYKKKIINMKKSNEQELIDIMFQIGLTIHDHKFFKNKNQEEIAEWIRGQLNECGFKVEPVGTSHGVLIRGA